MKDLATYMQDHPHNTDCGDRFMELVGLAYSKDKTGASLEEFVQGCLDSYGGTVAGAMIDYLRNNIK